MNLIFGLSDQVRNWYEQPHNRGLRINTLKLPVNRAYELGFSMEPTPFSPLGFRLIDDAQRPGRSPWHHAGAIYMQEPSAMSAVTALDPQPGERILDMCAAPGGKSTQIASLIGRTGLLVANEYVRTRANVLVSNFERTGVSRAVVTSLHPDEIADRLPCFFDRVLVDAPCSGEGMFRREEAAVTEWSPEHVQTCAVRQRGILDSASRCVSEGGVLVYSTCTFAPEENEFTVAAFLEQHHDFRLEAISSVFGRPGLNCTELAAFASSYPSAMTEAQSPENITLTRRIFPSDGGEGHFVARLRRSGSRPSATSELPGNGASADNMTNELLEKCFLTPPTGFFHRQGDAVYMMPCPLDALNGLPVIRSGVPVGNVEKNRIEPHHALFMAADPDSCANRLQLRLDDPRLEQFLHGEQIDISEDIKGYTAVLCEGIITGFGKASSGVLKNRYPKGLRIL